MREVYGIIKPHSQQPPCPFEPPPLYPASSPDPPLDPDFPFMVNFLLMLQYLHQFLLPMSSSFCLAQLISKDRTCTNVEGSYVSYVALENEKIHRMRKQTAPFTFAYNAGTIIYIFFISMAYLFLEGGKEPSLAVTH